MVMDFTRNVIARGNCTNGPPQCAVAFDFIGTAKIREDARGIIFKKVSTLWPESAVAHCSDQFFFDMPSREGLYPHTAKLHAHVESIHTIVIIGPVPCT